MLLILTIVVEGPLLYELVFLIELAHHLILNSFVHGRVEPFVVVFEGEGIAMSLAELIHPLILPREIVCAIGQRGWQG
jgi:hypothetical protein